ncbi:hypothetical protein [Botrimarina hoheduenensis]|uniref:PEP-CTERM protein-sorting domain-containing protein n=1 Tax=Botrimarina hoheduenensis TaxID=2528000 RepID=A0A5C5WEH7_9BACT|nr:hypothetical protein [Botrimarina hoheduenensis]TWT48897.1 hypothetical protein Pla111_06730 [Botrimarina hoheduenensis]
MKRLLGLSVVALGLAIAPGASAQTVFVNDTFESYADQSAFLTGWRPEAGDGFSGGAGSSAQLVLSGAPEAVAGQQGNAATGVSGQINEQTGGFSPTGVVNLTGYQLAPSETEKIVVRGDIFARGDQSNSLAGTDQSFRQTLGLRSDIFDRNPDPGITEAGVNFLELGYYNESSCLPTNPSCVGPTAGDPDNGIPPTEGDPEFRDNADFMFRMVLFDFASLGDYKENGVSIGSPVLQSPNWQQFPLNPDLDLVTTTLPNGSVGNGDGRVNLIDIGDGWHTFQAEIFDTKIVLTLDLFGDELDNVTGLGGVDATVEVEIAMAASFTQAPFDLDPAPMNSLRIGAPSGVSSLSGTALFDNIYLALEDATTAPAVPGDFNGDGKVDNGDLNLLLGNWGSPTVPVEWINGFETPVDNGELNALLGNWGFGVGVAVPEPASALLAALACGLVARRRR